MWVETGLQSGLGSEQHDCVNSSFIPRLFPPPLCDRLQQAKTEVGGLGERCTCVMSGRHEGGGRCPIVVTHKVRVDQPWVYRTMNCIDAVFQTLQSQALGQDITRRTSIFFVWHCPPPSRLPSRLPDVYLTSRMWLFLPGLLLCFCTLQAIKNWMGTAWDEAM